MSNLLQVIQQISADVMRAQHPCDIAYGTVSQAEPLEIRLDGSQLCIGGETIILTAPVIEYKLHINKHNHPIGDALKQHTHSYTCAAAPTPPGAPALQTGAALTLLSTTTVDDIVLEAHATERGEDLPTESNSDEIIITLNRALEADDKVLMLRVMGGQQYIVLSRLFSTD